MACLSANAEALLAEMRTAQSPAYRAAAEAAYDALSHGTLLGIVPAHDRWRIRNLPPGVAPAPASTGALFQCAPRVAPPKNERDLPGWIVLADAYAGGLLVLAHEISHFRNRWLVWRLAQEPVALADEGMREGREEGDLGWVRATFLNEVAARHTAYLASTAYTPGRSKPLDPGALFACAVAIARYPEVYNDVGAMAHLISTGDEANLRDQVGLWLQGLDECAFFAPGSEHETLHRAYLRGEVTLAAAGRDAPVTLAEGTL